MNIYLKIILAIYSFIVLIGTFYFTQGEMNTLSYCLLLFSFFAYIGFFIVTLKKDKEQ